MLFTGSMRKNLDPFGQHSDEDLWRALEEVGTPRLSCSSVRSHSARCIGLTPPFPPAGAAQVGGGGAAQEAGDGAGRIGVQLQRGPEAAGVSGPGRPPTEPHPGHRRGHGQRGPQVWLGKISLRLFLSLNRSVYRCPYCYPVSLQDG